MNPKFFVLLFFWLLIGCQAHEETSKTGTLAEKAMVVSARAEASAIGLDIMQRGGNAFDAMVATELALAVSYPFAGNIGGGGFMVYRLADGKVGSLDFREVAPDAAHKDIFLDENGNVIAGLSTESALSVGIPGTVAGIYEAHRKFGKLPFAQLVQPAIDLARKGVIVSPAELERLKKYRHEIVKRNGPESSWNRLFRVGDTLRYEALANTLEKIAVHGSSAFYEGEIAEQLVDYLQKKGGIITLEDLKNYQAIWREPLVFEYQDAKIITMGPPSSGGVALAQMLGMYSQIPKQKSVHNDAQYIQRLTEVMRRAYADRNEYLGDPDFVKIPLRELTSEAYLRRRMHSYRPQTATKTSRITPGKISWKESDETTHYSIVDPYGNAVAVTTTLNDAFGSKFYPESLGFFLNNQMDDFSSKPGHPNIFGLVGSQANSIAPRKRMLSSMTPTIIEKNGKLWMVLGSPGGSTIITTVLQTFLNVHEFGMGMQEAVSKPRFHHQGLPDELVLEPDGFSEQIISRLRIMGYPIHEKKSRVIGKVNAIKILENGQLEAGADPRGEEAARGF